MQAQAHLPVLHFQSIPVRIIDHAGKSWVTLDDVAVCLSTDGLKLFDPLSVNKRNTVVRHINQVYTRHADEFRADMTAMVHVPTAGGPQEKRIFSLRGAHLLSMFARTPEAKRFREWVLDVLEAQYSQAKPSTPPLLPGQIEVAIEAVPYDAEVLSAMELWFPLWFKWRAGRGNHKQKSQFLSMVFKNHMFSAGSQKTKRMRVPAFDRLMMIVARRASLRDGMGINDYIEMTGTRITGWKCEFRDDDAWQDGIKSYTASMPAA